MKFLLKQLQLFFPFVFPLYDSDDLSGGSLRLAKDSKEVPLTALLKRVTELEARLKVLEDKEKAREENFKKAARTNS